MLLSFSGFGQEQSFRSKLLVPQTDIVKFDSLLIKRAALFLISEAITLSVIKESV